MYAEMNLVPNIAWNLAVQKETAMTTEEEIAQGMIESLDG